MNIQYTRTTRALVVSAVSLIALPALLPAAVETKSEPVAPAPSTAKSTSATAAPAKAAATPATSSASSTKPVATTAATSTTSAKTPAATPAAPATSTKAATTATTPTPAKAPVAKDSTPAPAPVKTVAQEPQTSKSLAPVNKEPIRLPAVEAVRLEEVEVAEVQPTATAMAPTSSNLDTYQPQTVIDLPYISNHLPPTADFTTIVNVGPSAGNIVSNGPGLSEARRATIRGFAQNQYNVTYDGIPFQDSDDFTHHSVSYFPAKMIGRVTVDRGPGTASTLGVATFGGTVGLSSKDPRTDMAVIPFVTYGSYNTLLTHVEANSGLIKPLGDASLIGSYQHLESDGYQTNVYVKRDTTYVKYLQPITKNTTLTVLSNYNNSKFGAAQPVSQAQIDQFGRNFALTNNPNDLLYKGYNKRIQTTDFEYIGLNSSLTDTLHVDAKIYTYYYNNDNYGQSALGAANQAWHANDHIGRILHVDYRAWGEVVTASWDSAFGVLKFGAWHDDQSATRNQLNIDYTKGAIPDFNPALTPDAAYVYQQATRNYVTQLFAEYDWRVVKDLTINVGAKEVDFKRKYASPKNQTTALPLYYTQKMSKALGMGAINYSIQNDWTVYGQIAQGFLAPNQNQLYVVDPKLNQAKPQETVNYQLGTVYKKDRLNAAFDYYWINFKNYPHSSTDIDTGLTNVVMAKGAYFSGFESELTFYVGKGVSLYANGSINNATFKKSKLDVPLVPFSTGALGVMYEQSGFFTSLMLKYTGYQKVYFTRAPLIFNPDVASTVTSQYISGGYAMTNLTVGYSSKVNFAFLKSIKLKLEINNLTGRKVQVVDNVNAAGTVLYSVLPTQNYFISVSGEF